MDQEPVDPPDALDESPEALREAIARTRRDLARHIAALRDHLLSPRPILAAIEDTSMPAQKKPLKSSPSKGKKHPAEPREKRPDTHASHARSASAEDRRGAKKAANGAAKSSSKKAPASKARSANGSKAHHGVDPRKGKSSSSRGKKKRAEKSLLEKAGEVVDPVLAGAVVGAITGAARHVAHEPGALPLVADPSAQSAGAGGHEQPTTREVLGEMASGAALGAVTGAAKSILPADSASKAGKKRPKGRS